MLDRASEPIQTPHNQCVSRSGLIQQPSQLRALGQSARGGIDEDLRAARRLQRIDLQSGILIIGGDPRVPKQHAHEFNVAEPTDSPVKRHIVYDTDFRNTCDGAGTSSFVSP